MKKYWDCILLCGDIYYFISKYTFTSLTHESNLLISSLCELTIAYLLSFKSYLHAVRISMLDVGERELG